MSTPPTRDPIDELRGAESFRDDQLPTDSRDRLWSRIQEARMAEQPTDRFHSYPLRALDHRRLRGGPGCRRGGGPHHWQRGHAAARPATVAEEAAWACASPSA